MNRSLKLLAALFTVSGVLHLVRPETFESIVPKQLPNKRELVYASGAVELVCAGLLLREDTRRVGGLLSALLLAGVFPANVQMTVSTVGKERAPGWFKALTVARLPMQYPMIRVALNAARGKG